MKINKQFIFISLLVLILIFSSSCKRTGIEEPSPFGPSTYSLLLSVSAQPNVISAGISRETVTIRVSLKKYDGSAISDQIVHFEIRDALGQRVDVGLFNGNLAAVSRTTDLNGSITLTYQGPLAEELATDTQIYIYAMTDWQGTDYITEFAPIYITRGNIAVIFELLAQPDVIFAGTSRETTTITVSLKNQDKSAISGQVVHFQVRDALGQRVNIGLFDGNVTAVSRTTDQNGSITLTYHGPLSDEVNADTQIYIYAQIDGQGTDYISELAPIYIIREETGVVFDLTAQPNVIYCTSDRPQSLLKAVFKKTDGSPLPNRRIYFYVLSGPGEFEDGKRKTYVLTDSNGVASINYIGPTNKEISYDQFVELRGQPETNTPFYIHTEVSVRLIKGED